MASRARTAVVSLLAVALLAWFLRGANVRDVVRHLGEARVDLLAGAFLLMASTYWVRTFRWQVLLAPIGPTRFRSVFRAGVIGFAALSLLPARAGDLLRPYLVARQEALPFSSAFATIVIERVLDLLMVLLLMAVYVWGFAGPAALPPALMPAIEVSSAIAGGGALALMAVMWVLASHPDRIGTLVLTLTRVLPRGIAVRLASFAGTFSSGFAVVRSPRQLLQAFAWSLPLWLAIAAETWAVSAALGVVFPFTGSFLLQALLVVGVAVPTPGGVGSYHEAYRLGVTLFFGAANDRAVAAAILVHVISFVPVVVAGIVFMAQDGLTLGRLGELAVDAREKEQRRTDEVPVLRSSGR